MLAHNLSQADLDALRYDGPTPPRAVPPATKIRKAMRLHRRMAMDYAREAVRQDQRAAECGIEKLRRYHSENAIRSRRNFAWERKVHSELAAELGALICPRAVEI